jgi:hypothetical protein
LNNRDEEEKDRSKNIEVKTKINIHRMEGRKDQEYWLKRTRMTWLERSERLGVTCCSLRRRKGKMKFILPGERGMATNLIGGIRYSIGKKRNEYFSGKAIFSE